LIEIRKSSSGSLRVCGPAAAPVFSREKAIGAERHTLNGKGSGMKCKVCSTEFPRQTFMRFEENVCPRCGKRYPSGRSLLVAAFVTTASAAAILIMSIVWDRLPRGLVWVVFAAALAASCWAEYAVITRRRKRVSAPPQIRPD